MATIYEALTLALHHHQAGRLQAAENIYRQILAVDPNHIDALHLFGLLAHQLGKHTVAIDFIGRAIRLNETEANFHNNLGSAYRALPAITEALACYRRAVELNPHFAEAHCNLGSVFQDQGKLDEAAACYRRALQVQPDFAPAHNNLGAVFKDQGKLDEAVACFRRAVQLMPNFAEAHNNLGAALKDQGKLSEAVACYRRAIELNADSAEAHSNLGTVFKDQGKLDDAAVCYRRAVQLKPDFAEAHCDLGSVFQDQGKLDDAAVCYRRAVQLKPDFAKAHNNLGTVFKDQGKLGEAAAFFRRAIELKADHAEAHNNLGTVFKDQGKLDEATACFQRALNLKPGFAEAHCNLGTVYHDRRNVDEAVACYRRALHLKTDFAEAHRNLGTAYQEQGKLDEAVACFLRVLELKADFPEAHCNLGTAYQDQGKPDEAAACYRRAVELKPDYAEAHNNLGAACKDQGKLDEAIACYRRAMELNPEFAQAHSNLLLSLQYCHGVTPAALAQAHAEFDRQHAAPLRSAVTEAVAAHDRHGRLRLGFVSPDLARHPVGYFLVRVLENLGQHELEVFCYSDRMFKDGLTHRLQAAASQWRDVNGVSDEELTTQIRADHIDILFDLAGHTAHNRLLVFARKPAPIQVTYAGYVGTTGLNAMDYLLADRYEVPPGAEQHYQEQVLRMPDGYVCYDPQDYAPAVNPLPATALGHVTFGCFNNPAKVTPQTIEVWAKILHRLPQARLVLKYRGWKEPAMARRYAEMFVAGGIEPNRLEFQGNSPHAELLAEYHRIDLALDPFPYSGGLTTCEALWMGVPVITYPLETFASRHSLSHLSNVGITETIARNLDEYVEIAVALAADLPRLAAIRAELRERMAVSPLCDGERFAKNLLALLREVAARLL